MSIHNHWVRMILWVATLAVMVMIFLFSAQDGEQSSSLSDGVTAWILRVVLPDFAQRTADEQAALVESLSGIIRKAAHFSEYAALGFLLLLLSRSYALPLAGLWAWLAATVYACTDEWHQLTVAQRTGSPIDVCIDSAGALFGAVAAALLMALWIRIRARSAIGGARTGGRSKR